ncbi:hypothetical protein EYF80_064658 [Liparis tanakae]|uniref:Uncharacterized protein n=1 Tax=Liparis tanakae TaxID=230148 RepID=A0A4Z2E9L6_9TELE|nr:hypothetical protein EYF80_064658 [Liparis tanakae]
MSDEGSSSFLMGEGGGVAGFTRGVNRFNVNDLLLVCMFVLVFRPEGKSNNESLQPDSNQQEYKTKKQSICSDLGSGPDAIEADVIEELPPERSQRV